MKKTLFYIFAVFVCAAAFSQENEGTYSSRIVTEEEKLPETDTIITNRIKHWQEKKFGLFMHWGIYTEWEVVESWSICNEEWIDRQGANYEDYKRAYFDLNKQFNPKNFNPSSWAKAARRAGMKYVVFTTKHHDGFCMYDTKYTDYSVMGKECPLKRDVTKEIIDAFRNEDFWIGLYFSKPDWYNKDYWSPMWATPDRNVNYDISKHKDMWQRFSDFTFGQIEEITHNYGDIDILWLDGGWIRPEWSVNDESLAWLGAYRRIQDINMPKIAAMARENNPDLIIVDRSVGGKYENYRTPEQQVPNKPLDYPWETCMTIGNSWSYSSKDQYKSTTKLIHLLVDIVCKGGNFLLNVPPDKDGNLPLEALKKMDSIGQWININGKAIYETEPIKPYKSENICYTKCKDGQIYAIILIDEGGRLQNEYAIPSELKITNGKKRILGSKQKAMYKNGTLILSKKFLEQNKETSAITIALLQ